MCVVAQNIENFLKYDFKGFSLKYRVFFIQPSRNKIPLGCQDLITGLQYEDFIKYKKKEEGVRRKKP